MNKEEAIEYIQEWLKDEYVLNGKDRVVLNMAIKALQQERPKGEWVEVVHKTEQYDREGVKSWAVIFQCPKCGFILNAIEGHTEQYYFCPNCGADMRGDKK